MTLINNIHPARQCQLLSDFLLENDILIPFKKCQEAVALLHGFDSYDELMDHYRSTCGDESDYDEGTMKAVNSFKKEIQEQLDRLETSIISMGDSPCQFMAHRYFINMVNWINKYFSQREAKEK